MSRYKIKIILFILILVLIKTNIVFAGNFLTENTTLSFTTALVPPHGEPVIGDRVARYRLNSDYTLSFKYLQYEGKATLWLTQKWHLSSEVGHGIEAWKNSDWGFDKSRVSLNHILYFGKETWSVRPFAENYQPINGSSWGGVGTFGNYYLIGVKIIQAW